MASASRWGCVAVMLGHTVMMMMTTTLLLLLIMMMLCCVVLWRGLVEVHATANGLGPVRPRLPNEAVTHVG